LFLIGESENDFLVVWRLNLGFLHGLWRFMLDVAEIVELLPCRFSGLMVIFQKTELRLFLSTDFEFLSIDHTEIFFPRLPI
jgi:hypothetical protein